MEVFPPYPSIEKPLFVDVRDGKFLNLSWSEVHVSREGYLYAQNKTGKVTLIQWVNHMRSGARNV